MLVNGDWLMVNGELLNTDYALRYGPFPKVPGTPLEDPFPNHADGVVALEDALGMVHVFARLSAAFIKLAF